VLLLVVVHAPHVVGIGIAVGQHLATTGRRHGHVGGCRSGRGHGYSGCSVPAAESAAVVVDQHERVCRQTEYLSAVLLRFGPEARDAVVPELF